MLEPWSRLTFTGAARQPGPLVFDFVGRFVCQPADDGATTVTHSYEFTFKCPFRLVERKLAAWLQQEIEQEVTNLATAISVASPSSTKPDAPEATGREQVSSTDPKQSAPWLTVFSLAPEFQAPRSDRRQGR